MERERDPREVWEDRYARYARRGGRVDDRQYDPWLDDHAAVLGGARGCRVLDLGCGRGLDARRLAAFGVSVVAMDFSGHALGLVETTAPAARRVLADTRRGLPFRNGAFPVILANLTLHYFGRRRTARVLRDVRRCLAPGGVLLARMNAFDDIHHGALGGEEIEPEFLRVRGTPKRFSTREGLEDLFRDGWRIHRMAHRTTGCYGTPKALWELCLEKATGSLAPGAISPDS